MRIIILPLSIIEFISQYIRPSDSIHFSFRTIYALFKESYEEATNDI